MTDDQRAAAEAKAREWQQRFHGGYEAARTESIAGLLLSWGEEQRAEHHALGNWTTCKRCTKFYQDDEIAAMEHARLTERLAERDAQVARLTEAVDKLDESCSNIATQRDSALAERARLTVDRDHWKTTSDSHRHMIELALRAAKADGFEDIDVVCARLTEEREHWRVKAECYGAMVHGCEPALERAGIRVDSSGEGGAVKGIAEAVTRLTEERDTTKELWLKAEQGFAEQRERVARLTTELDVERERVHREARLQARVDQLEAECARLTERVDEVTCQREAALDTLSKWARKLREAEAEAERLRAELARLKHWRHDHATAVGSVVACEIREDALRAELAQVKGEVERKDKALRDTAERIGHVRLRWEHDEHDQEVTAAWVARVRAALSPVAPAETRCSHGYGHDCRECRKRREAPAETPAPPRCVVCRLSEDQTGEILQGEVLHKSCASHVARGGRIPAERDDISPVAPAETPKDMRHPFVPWLRPEMCARCGQDAQYPWHEAPHAAEPKPGGMVAGDRMERSIVDFVRACETLLREEQTKPAPDTALIGVLCDAVRLTRELEHVVREPKPTKEE